MWGGSEGGRRKGRDEPQETGGAAIDLGNADDADIFQTEEQSCEDDGRYRAACGSFELTVSEAKTETMCLMTKRVGLGSLSLRRQPASCANTLVYQGCVSWENCVRERRPYCRNLPARDADQPLYGSPLYDQHTASLRLKVRMLKAEEMETLLYTGVSRGAQPWPISP